MTKVISVKNLSFSYDNYNVLENISFDVFQNDFFAILGPNGGGKSTLLKLILGLITPQNGNIEVFGKNPKSASRSVGYVPQNTNINPHFPISALDVVLMGYDRQKKVFLKHSKENIQRAEQLLEDVGVSNFYKKRMFDYSGGQRQRIMIARAMFANPDILLLDEPTSNIDVQGQKQIFELLKKLNEKVTILVVSHDIATALDYATTIGYVNQKLSYHKSHPLNTSPMISQFKISGQHFCEIELMQMLKKGLM